MGSTSDCAFETGCGLKIKISQPWCMIASQHYNKSEDSEGQRASCSGLSAAKWVQNIISRSVIGRTRDPSRGWAVGVAREAKDAEQGHWAKAATLSLSFPICKTAAIVPSVFGLL